MKCQMKCQVCPSEAFQEWFIQHDPRWKRLWLCEKHSQAAEQLGVYCKVNPTIENLLD